jgi:SAM-dependent methyltransferase
VVNVVAGSKARLARHALRVVRPLRDRLRDESGICSVCGRVTRFAFNSWVIPSDLIASWSNPDVSHAYARRESLFCRSCGSSLRVRRFADALLLVYRAKGNSIADLVSEEHFRTLDVAEINTIGPRGALHSFLRKLPSLAFSEYHSGRGLGELVHGVRNEDLSQLTYDDERFDLVLSSDTLEHVPDFHAALRESRRVLRPGGRHIFTVPVVASRTKTELRTQLDVDGNLRHRFPPLYHGRGAGLYRWVPVRRDLLTFTEFGADLVEHLKDAGFDVTIINQAGDSDTTGASFVYSAQRIDNANSGGVIQSRPARGHEL